MAEKGYSNQRAMEMDKLESISNKPRPTASVMGSGDFGKALAKRLLLAGYDVVIGSRSPDARKSNHLFTCNVVSVEEASDFSDVIFLAIPRRGYDEMMKAIAERLNGKIVVDVSNRTKTSGDGVSHAEYLASLIPEARVVKGFNVISAWALENDIYGGSRLVYICGDHLESKEKVGLNFFICYFCGIISSYVSFMIFFKHHLIIVVVYCISPISIVVFLHAYC
jgi:metalloreductase STEAP2